MKRVLNPALKVLRGSVGRGHVPEPIPCFCLPSPHSGYWAPTLTSSLLLQFLKRNPVQRIGGGPGDAAEVQVSLGLA